MYDFNFENKDLIFYLQIDDIRPLSLNNMYGTNRSGHRYLIEEGRMYEERIMKEISKAVYDQGLCERLMSDPVMSTCLHLHFGLSDLCYKNGKLKRYDCSNLVKPVEDAISKCLGFDDSCNFEVLSRKFYNQVNFIRIFLYRYVMKENV